MVLALAALYLRFGGLPWMRGAFYGIGAAVIAIIAVMTNFFCSVRIMVSPPVYIPPRVWP